VAKETTLKASFWGYRFRLVSSLNQTVLLGNRLAYLIVQLAFIKYHLAFYYLSWERLFAWNSDLFKLMAHLFELFRESGARNNLQIFLNKP